MRARPRVSEGTQSEDVKETPAPYPVTYSLSAVLPSFPPSLLFPPPGKIPAARRIPRAALTGRSSRKTTGGVGAATRNIEEGTERKWKLEDGTDRQYLSDRGIYEVFLGERTTEKVTLVFLRKMIHNCSVPMHSKTTIGSKRKTPPSSPNPISPSFPPLLTKPNGLLLPPSPGAPRGYKRRYFSRTHDICPSSLHSTPTSSRGAGVKARSRWEDGASSIFSSKEGNPNRTLRPSRSSSSPRKPKPCSEGCNASEVWEEPV